MKPLTVINCAPRVVNYAPRVVNYDFRVLITLLENIYSTGVNVIKLFTALSYKLERLSLASQVEHLTGASLG